MPVIPREERHKLDARCDLLVSDALAALDAFNGTASPTLWLPLAQREQLAFYRGVAPVLTSPPHEPDGREQRLRFLVTGYLPGSLAQVTSGLYSDTTRDLTLQQCVLLAYDNSSATTNSKHQRHSGSAPVSGSDRRSSSGTNAESNPLSPASSSSSTLIDASVLYVGEQEHRRVPFRFAGTKWYAWRSQGIGSGSVERDLLAYERSGAVNLDNDDSGSSNSGEASGEIMYHVMQSIERPPQGVDAAKFPPGLRHMKLSVCYLYRQVYDDLVECFAIGEYPALRRGMASSLQRTEDAAVADRVLMVARALAAYSAKRLSRLIEKNSRLPVIMSKSCLRCSTRRTVFDPLRTCSICKKSVCQSCREERIVFKLNVDTNRPETETFCRKCLVRSNLPNAEPIALEKIRQQQKLRRSSSDRSRSSQSHQRSSDAKQQHRHHRHSVASRGSSGSRGSVGSVGASNASSPVRHCHSYSHSQQQPPANSKVHTNSGFNYDALFRHYAVEKPVMTRSRASTLPDSATGGNTSSTSSSSVTATAIAADTAEQLPVAIGAALAAGDDVLQGEEVVLGESLRETQLGLPVILMDVKPLRETQLGVPVAAERDRASEPSLHTTSHATFFPVASSGGASGASDQSRPARPSSSSPSPPPSPSRRSDLYLDCPETDGANRSGIERLYQTYLERKEKLQTAAAGEQQLRNTRLEVSRQHQQTQQSRRSPALSNSTAQVPHCSSSSATALPHSNDEAALSLDALRRHHHRPSSRPRRSEALPTKQHFHMDLYAQP